MSERISENNGLGNEKGFNGYTNKMEKILACTSGTSLGISIFGLLNGTGGNLEVIFAGGIALGIVGVWEVNFRESCGKEQK